MQDNVAFFKRKIVILTNFFYGVSENMEKNLDLTVFYEFLTEHSTVVIHAINAQGQTIIYN